MKLEWLETGQEHNKPLIYSAKIESGLEAEIQAGVDAAMEYGIELMDRHVRDDSRYFICHWNAQEVTLSISLTDESKSSISPVSIRLVLNGLPKCSGVGSDQEMSEQIRFWITDYLSTSSDFLRYALIALFHTGDKNRGVLL